MADEVTCAVCGAAAPGSGTVCADCIEAAKRARRPKAPGLRRGGRRAYGSSQTVGMTLGLVAVCGMAALVFGPIPAAVVFGVVLLVGAAARGRRRAAPTRRPGPPAAARPRA